MLRYPRLLLAFAVAGVTAAATPPSPSPMPAWPKSTATQKPWTRWWWPGSAVDEAGLTRQLQQFADAGLGGVEITPIYGARGAESRYVTFLSPRWMALLEHTGREAQRLGLGVDMATCTGWPFGGPWVQPADAVQAIAWRDGHLVGAPTGMKVKRAAPGGEGLVIDPYSPAALQHYLAPFSAAFANFPAGLVRGQFHDSFEYYDAGWTPGLAAAFRELHGYDLDPLGAELTGARPLDADRLGRLKADYRATLAELHLRFLREWLGWSHAHGFIVRNQSHGAPANLLDLYGAVDIPETEIFGSTPFPIPGLRRDAADVRSDEDLPDSLMIRMASSAAHVMGRPLASSETCTWLREHWKVSLAMAKPEIDRLFADGINHLFYHGSAYSPPDAPWPGWLFYASTQFNPRNPWWEDFGALNAYVARVQSVLQSGRPDADVLLYWPFHDALDDTNGLMHQFTVHDVKGLRASAFGQLADRLTAEGFGLDFVSDAQLQSAHGEAGSAVTPGGRYRAIVVPATRRLPVETLASLAALARSGVPVLFEAPPADVPGLGRLEERRARFRTVLSQFPAGAPEVPADLGTALRQRQVRAEPIANTGIRVLRRARSDGCDYFYANLTARALDGWVTLGTAADTAVLLNPLGGDAGLAAVRPGEAGKAQVYLQLAPGESLLLRTLVGGAATELKAPWRYVTPAGTPTALTGTWQIEFTQGGPTLPPPLTTTALRSWTDLGGEEAQRFGGTARYRIEFEHPAGAADDWLLDLGDVRESARVRINGEFVATAWSLPLRVRVGRWLRPGRNVLELEVTNLAANRIRDLDRRGVDWKVMREINFVNIRYQPFDASRWPLTPSGLLGPVMLIPLQTLSPR